MLSKGGIFSFDLKVGCGMSCFSILWKGGLFSGFWLGFFCNKKTPRV